LLDLILFCAGNPNLNFFIAMKAEHCERFGCCDPFTTTNYHVTTTPKIEWDIVVSFDIAKADMRHGRRLQKIEDILEQNQNSHLTKEEVIAVVLYTGPMVSETFPLILI
jgi:hypothetical protein